jgi:hypothetical protein
MLELLRIPALPKAIALFAALASFFYTYHLAIVWTFAQAMREGSHDGQTGLGAAFLGLITGPPVMGETILTEAR